MSQRAARRQLSTTIEDCAQGRSGDGHRRTSQEVEEVVENGTEPGNRGGEEFDEAPGGLSRRPRPIRGLQGFDR